MKANRYASVYLLVPKNESAEAWVDENISAEAQRFGGGVVVEPRYLDDIIEGIKADGFGPDDFEVRS